MKRHFVPACVLILTVLAALLGGLAQQSQPESAVTTAASSTSTTSADAQFDHLVDGMAGRISVGAYPESIDAMAEWTPQPTGTGSAGRFDRVALEAKGVNTATGATSTAHCVLTGANLGSSAARCITRWLGSAGSKYRADGAMCATPTGGVKSCAKAVTASGVRPAVKNPATAYTGWQVDVRRLVPATKADLRIIMLRQPIPTSIGIEIFTNVWTSNLPSGTTGKTYVWGTTSAGANKLISAPSCVPSVQQTPPCYIRLSLSQLTGLATIHSTFTWKSPGVAEQSLTTPTITIATT